MTGWLSWALTIAWPFYCGRCMTPVLPWHAHMEPVIEYGGDGEGMTAEVLRLVLGRAGGDAP
jgi:hypothetical protein